MLPRRHPGIALQRLDTLHRACTCGSGAPYATCCAPRERAFLDDFNNPAPLYDLREALLAYTDAPRFEAWHRLAEGDWLGDAPWPADPATYEAQYRFAIERGWLSLPADGDDGPSVLETFADDPANPAPLQHRAHAWATWARYGLWQIDDPEPHGPATCWISSAARTCTRPSRAST